MVRWLLLLVLLVPAASANLCTASVDVDLHGAQASAAHGLLYYGNPARDLRQAIDADDDGSATSSEAAAYAFRLVADQASCDARLIRVDGKAPVAVSIAFEFHVRGDDSSSRENLEATVTLTASWQAAEGVVPVQVRFGQALSLPEVAACIDGDLADWFWADHWCGQSSTDGQAGVDHLQIAGDELQERIEPAQHTSAWNGEAFRFTGGSILQARSDALTVWVENPAQEDAAGFVGLWVGGSLVLGAFAVAYGLERSRIQIWRWLGILGFTRIRRDEVTENQRRQAILEAIRAEPGLSFQDVRRRTSLGNGTAVHHLRILEEHGFIEVVKQGVRVRYFETGFPHPLPPYLTEIQRSLLDQIHAVPGCNQSALADSLRLPRGTIAYNASVLQRLELVRIQNDGPQKLHFPATSGA